MSSIKRQDAAVTEFESLLLSAGWHDTWNLTNEEIALLGNVPVFVRGGIQEEQSKILEKPIYLIYTVTDDSTTSADNRRMGGRIYIDFQVYSQDPFEFDGDDTPEQGYILNLENSAENANWLIEFDGDVTMPQNLTAQIAKFQKNYTFSKDYYFI